MVKQYKYISMSELRSQRTKTKVFTIRTNGDCFLLGEIRWNGSWRQYCLIPTIQATTIWSKGCLNDVSDFLQKINKEQRNKK